MLGGLKGGMKEEERPEKRPKTELTPIGLFEGSVQNVVFLGNNDCREWNTKHLRDFFFIVPGSQTVCVRSQIDVKIGVFVTKLLDWLAYAQKLCVRNPVITFKGREVDSQDQLLGFPDKALFIIHPDNTIPDKYMNHSGKLWECFGCGLAYGAQRSFKPKCKVTGNSHKFLFGDSTQSTWGKSLDKPGRQDKPWACPEKHQGFVSQSNTVSLAQSSVIGSPVVDTPGLLAALRDSPVHAPQSSPRLLKSNRSLMLASSGASVSGSSGHQHQPDQQQGGTVCTSTWVVRSSTPTTPRRPGRTSKYVSPVLSPQPGRAKSTPPLRVTSTPPTRRAASASQKKVDYHNLLGSEEDNGSSQEEDDSLQKADESSDVVDILGGLKGGMKEDERSEKRPKTELMPLGLFEGSVKNVIFLGSDDCREWDTKQLRDFFFIVPGSQTVCVRSQIDVKIMVFVTKLMDWLAYAQNLSVHNPVITFKGKEVNSQDQLLGFPDKALFIIHPDNTIPEQYLNHSGKLWECSGCWLAYGAQRSFKPKCKVTGNPHKFLFEDSTQPTWGKSLDKPGRQDKPWACPEKHQGFVSQSHTVSLAQSSVNGSPVVDTPGLLAALMDSPARAPPSTPRLLKSVRSLMFASPSASGSGSSEHQHQPDQQQGRTVCTSTWVVRSSMPTTPRRPGRTSKYASPVPSPQHSRANSTPPSRFTSTPSPRRAASASQKKVDYHNHWGSEEDNGSSQEEDNISQDADDSLDEVEDI